jgi:nitrate/TMAO reductase-like tetraheme cytochrome c subunit
VAQEATAPPQQPPAATQGQPGQQRPSGPGQPGQGGFQPPPKVPSPAAETVFKNVKFFKGKPATDLMSGMIAADGGLGVQCEFCHYGTDLDKDGKKEKEDARKYFEVAQYVNDQYFRGRQRITCWSCHLGQQEPARFKMDEKAIADAKDEIGLKPEDEQKPAEQVFKNIQILKGLPAGRLPMVMTLYSAAVGKDCSFCHVPNKWEADDKRPKQRAREMMTMTQDVLAKFFNGRGPIGCFTCHHGNNDPERLGPWERPPQRSGQGQRPGGPGAQPPAAPGERPSGPPSSEQPSSTSSVLK